jgi:hypothetical protein
LVIAFLFVFLAEPTSLYADALTHPPVVTSITGPNTGYYGQTYSFTTSATSGDGYTLTTLFLQNDGATFSSKSVGDSGCTGTSCSFTGNFTPPTTGTFIIHAALNYTNGVDSNTCNSYSGDATTDCQNSGNKYITFVVSAAPTKPIVESITGPTTGIVGQSYNFSTVVSSITGVEISSIRLAQTNNASTPNNATNLAFKTAGVDSNCTSYLCAATGSFTPTVAGTYYIFTFSHFNNVDCDTHLSTIPLYTCFNSAGKYITFVAMTEAEAQNNGDNTENTDNGELPSTGVLSNQMRNILIGLGFISFGALTTQITRIMNILGSSSEKRTASLRSKLESRYK